MTGELQGPDAEHGLPPTSDLELMTAAARPQPTDVLRRQVRALYQGARYWLCLSLGLSVTLAAAVSPASAHTSALVGIALLCAVHGLGLTLIFAYRRHHQPPRPTQRWRKHLRALLATTGTSWGIALAWLQLAPATVPLALALAALLLFPAVILLRHDASSGGWMAAGFLVPSLLTAVWLSLSTQGSLMQTGRANSSLSWAEPITSLFLLTLLTVAALVILGLLARQTRQQLTRHLTQEALISYLDQARVLAEQMNQELDTEVRHREYSELTLRQAYQDLERRVRDRNQELSETNDLLNQQIKLRKSISDALVKSQTRLSQAIEASHLALWDWDLTSGQIYQSHFHSVFGPREMTTEEYQDNLRRHVHPDDFPRLRDATDTYLAGNSARYLVHYRIRTADGAWLWVEECGKAVRSGADGRVSRMLGTRRDITDDRQRDDQLRMAKSVFDNTAEGIFVLDPDFRFLSINRAFSRITGFSEEEVLGRPLVDLSNIPRKEEIFEQARVALDQDGRFDVELFERRKGGDYFPVWLQINLVRNEAGEVTHYAGLLSDLTERKQVTDRLQFLLHYDDLTGLANRVLFRDRLHNALSRARGGHTRYALLNINLDRFKQINDSLGQDAGDELLKQIANRLLALLPTADTLARLGGDEFCMLLEAASRTEVAALAEQILTRLRAPLFVQGQEIMIAASIGITMLPDSARDLQPALQQVNTAVRQAKYLGGNTFEFYNNALRAVSRQRIRLETELRKALRHHSLEVYYQPKRRLSNGLIDSVEALVRWNHPERGLILPAEFVPIAEDSGLIVEIGEHVLNVACQQAQAWQHQGLGRIQVAVNLSAHQLRQGNLAETVQAALQLSGLDPRLLELELTESALMENVARAVALLDDLRAAGVRVSIDDFGTGYSSLSYLKRFPIDAIKIDQVFIKNVAHSPQDAAITQAIIALGRSLKLEVVAEGVESAEHATFLRAQGCDLIQGYHIAPALTGDDLAILLLNQQIEQQQGRKPARNARTLKRTENAKLL